MRCSRLVKTDRELRPEELREVRITAGCYLTEPHTIPKVQSLAGWHLELRLWHTPSFSAPRSWGIYQRNEQGARRVKTLVRQVTWDCVSDWNRLSEPITGLEQGFHSNPTIEVRDRPLETADFEKRLAALVTISFPAFSARGIGIDGEQFGIAYPAPGASVEWWCDGPESWRPLTHWAAEVRSWLTEITVARPQPLPTIPFRPRLP